MSAIEDALKTLNAQWYNAITAQCGLSQNQFQLYQGTKPMDRTSEGMWSIFDTVPPKSIDNYYNIKGTNNFSSDYGAMLYKLKSNGTQELRNVLTDDYEPFMAAWKADTSDDDMVTFFKSWSLKNCPDKYAAGSKAIMKFIHDPLLSAQEMWEKAGGFGGKAKAYTKTIDDMNNEIDKCKEKKHALLNSKTQSSDVTHTWAGGSANVEYRFFSASVDVKYDKLIQKFLGSGIEIDATFGKLATIDAKPLYQQMASVKNYEPWFRSDVLNDAFSKKDNTEWDDLKDYETYFGQKGQMLRAVSAIVVVDDVSVTIKSNAFLSEDEDEMFKAEAKLGFWPFFRADGSGGWTHNYDFGDRGEISVTMESSPGNPYILGIDQAPINEYLKQLTELKLAVRV